MSPCSVLIFSLVLISFNKIDSVPLKCDESSTLEHYPVDSIDLDVKVVSKRTDEISATETSASVEHPNTVIVVDTVDDDSNKEPATINEAQNSDVKSNTANVVETVVVKEELKENVKILPNDIKVPDEAPHVDSATLDKNDDVNGKSEADSRIVRNVPMISTSDDSFGTTSGLEYLPPLSSSTSGPEYLPPISSSTSGPEYLPPITSTSTQPPTTTRESFLRGPDVYKYVPGRADDINPKTVIGVFG